MNLKWQSGQSPNVAFVVDATEFQEKLGRRVCHSLACSYMRAARKRVGSLKVGPSSWKPIGSGCGSCVNPHGTLIPGMPAMLQVRVKTSSRYTASGSADFSPILNAGVGEVGVSITSPRSH